MHPSVAAMAKALLAGVPIDYAGDPVRDMSTSAFLDKFIQKKPKVSACHQIQCGNNIRDANMVYDIQPGHQYSQKSGKLLLSILSSEASCS